MKAIMTLLTGKKGLVWLLACLLIILCGVLTIHWKAFAPNLETVVSKIRDITIAFFSVHTVADGVHHYLDNKEKSQ